MYAMTFVYVRHDICLCTPCHLFMYAMTFVYVNYDICLCTPSRLFMYTMMSPKLNGINVI